MRLTHKIFLSFFLLHTFFSFSSLGSDYLLELKRARKENKPAILYFYSPFCPYCELMERNVIVDEKVKKIIDSDIVFIWIDGDKRKDLMETYGIWGFPTFVLLQPSGKVIVSIPGYIHKEHFLKILEYLRGGHYRKIPLGKYLAGNKR